MTHPFTVSGLGEAPFKLVAVAQIPPISLAESNPAAYQRGIAMLPPGCGTCKHCGMAIMLNFIVESAEGRRSAIGCDCIRKLGHVDKPLVKAVDEAARKLAREKRQAAAAVKREARAAAWRAERAQWEIDNAERLAREKAEREAAAAALVARAQRFAFMLPALRSAESSWCSEIADAIEAGRPPTGRAVEILRDIYGRRFGRKGSAKFEAAAARFDETVSA
jgi:hypothetical protein